MLNFCLHVSQFHYIEVDDNFDTQIIRLCFAVIRIGQYESNPWKDVVFRN